MDETQLTATYVLDVLREESEARRKRAKVLRRWIYGTVLFVVLIAFVSIVRHKEFDFSIFASFSVLSGITYGLTNRHKEAARLAAALQSPDVIPYLVECLGKGDRDLDAVVQQSLKASLPLLDTSTVKCVPEADFVQLAMLSRQTQDLALAEEIVAALERVGPAAALPHLNEISEGRSAVRREMRDRLANGAKMASASIRMRTAREVIDQYLPPSTDRTDVDNKLSQDNLA